MLTWSDIQLGLQQAGLLLDVIVLETKGEKDVHAHKHTYETEAQNHTSRPRQFGRGTLMKDDLWGTN